MKDGLARTDEPNKKGLWWGPLIFISLTIINAIIIYALRTHLKIRWE